MMESADLGQRTAAALLGSLNGARFGRILLECEMSARAVVVAKVAAQTTTEVSLVEDNHVVEQFASDGADHTLGEGVLPRRARCGENLGGAHTLHPLPKLAPEDAVAIAEQVGWRRVIGECFHNLLRGPSGGGAIELHDLAATVQQDHEYVEQTEGRRRYDEKVDRDELGEVVLEERSPRLRGWPWATWHKPGNSALRNVESELEEFPVDMRCTPERIRERHVGREGRTTWSASRHPGHRFESPIQKA